MAAVAWAALLMTGNGSAGYEAEGHDSVRDSAPFIRSYVGANVSMALLQTSYRGDGAASLAGCATAAVQSATADQRGCDTRLVEGLRF